MIYMLWTYCGACEWWASPTHSYFWVHMIYSVFSDAHLFCPSSQCTDLFKLWHWTMRQPECVNYTDDTPGIQNGKSSTSAHMKCPSIHHAFKHYSRWILNMTRPLGREQSKEGFKKYNNWPVFYWSTIGCFHNNKDSMGLCRLSESSWAWQQSTH